MQSGTRGATSASRLEAARAEVRVGGTVTKYLRAGAGQPVLLVRQGSAPDILWAGLGAELAATMRVVVPELPPGTTDVPAWLRAFLDGLGLPAASLVTDAALAADAIAFALLEPDRVTRLVFVARDVEEAIGLACALSDAVRALLPPALVVCAQGAPVTPAVRPFLAGDAGPAA